MIHTASCLCGGVRYRIEGALPPLQICHCRQCQKAQGGAFAAVLPVPAGRVHFDGGESLLQAYESSPGKQRVFCGRCGSPVFSRRESLPGVLRLRAGLIDGPLGVKPASHAHTASRCDWWDIDDGLPQYDQGRPGA